MVNLRFYTSNKIQGEKKKKKSSTEKQAGLVEIRRCFPELCCLVIALVDLGIFFQSIWCCPVSETEEHPWMEATLISQFSGGKLTGATRTIHFKSK